MSFMVGCNACLCLYKFVALEQRPIFLAFGKIQNGCQQRFHTLAKNASQFFLDGEWRAQLERRWRVKMLSKLRDHVIVCGYGTKGRSAVQTLLNNGLEREAIVVVDPSDVAMQDAHADGLAVVSGDATRRGELRGRFPWVETRGYHEWSHRTFGTECCRITLCAT